jgi:hypothetical protein
MVQIVSAMTRAFFRRAGDSYFHLDQPSQSAVTQQLRARRLTAFHRLPHPNIQQATCCIKASDCPSPVLQRSDKHAKNFARAAAFLLQLRLVVYTLAVKRTLSISADLNRSRVLEPLSCNRSHHTLPHEPLTPVHTRNYGSPCLIRIVA